MTTKFDELVAKLKDIFQIDKPELDFGIYKMENEVSELIYTLSTTHIAICVVKGAEAQRGAFAADSLVPGGWIFGIIGA